MRIAVAGGTGLVGRRVNQDLRSRGHHVVVLARGNGIDLMTGRGLTDAVVGVDAVVDVTNTIEPVDADAERFFSTVTGNLLTAEMRAGVAHHVLLSIVGLDQLPGTGHYGGKRRQESMVENGPVPWTIQRSTQFFDFPAIFADRTKLGGVSVIPPLLVQPVATVDVAAVLAEHATGVPRRRVPDLAGPETHDFVDMARRTLGVRGDSTVLRASWRGGRFGVDMAGEILLPGEFARRGPTTFDTWLAAGAPS